MLGHADERPRRDPLDAPWPRPGAAYRPRWPHLAVAAVVFTWLLIDVISDGPMRAFDHRVDDAVSALGWRDDAVLKVVGFVLSQAGGRGFNLIWMLALCLAAARARGTLAPFAKLLSAAAIMYVAVAPFKLWLARSFPADPAGDELHAPGSLGGAFPSGHLTNATLLSGVAAWIAIDYALTRWVRWAVGAYALAAPAVAAFGVLIMNYHWLSDVIAGTCSGVLLLALVRWIWASPLGVQAERALERNRRSDPPKH